MAVLSRSEKDHLEAIYVLTRRMGIVRSVDVANYLEHSKPSVTVAVQNLCAKGYLRKDEHGLVLTELGRAIAGNILDRHCVIAHALKGLGINEPTAIEDARSIERVVSDEVVEIAARAIQCGKWLTGSCPSCPCPAQMP